VPTTDFVVVGSGLTGAVIARTLRDAGRDVVVLDRREHLGGNVHDHLHPSGIRMHTYGPHYFRTNAESLWRFVTRFDEFYPYVAQLRSEVDGVAEQWPIAASYIRRTVGDSWAPAFSGTPANFEQASLSMMPEVVYRKFVKGYTEKQWGVPAQTLSADLARRFDVREDDDPRLMRHQYQGIPRRGYAAWMAAMLDGIPVELGVDFLHQRTQWTARRCLIFTGPIDEYFGFDLGRLAYRGQRRTHQFHPDVGGFLLPVGQVNHPDPASGPQIRTLEWKRMMPPEVAATIRGTVLTQETPYTPESPEGFEYPFPDDQNHQLYAAYRQRAEADPRLLICGRLGEYRYYDMDQAIGRALMLSRRLLGEEITGSGTREA
jgi:UDP-galactopyranose mutase